jgi:hypothetical protein
VPPPRHSGKIFSFLKKGASPSVALGEEGFKFFSNFFPECNTRERVEKKVDGTDGVKSSPSATGALGEAFPESTIFGSRGRPLPREPLPRKLFPECCTRGRLPRVFLALPRVLEALGEASGSRSDFSYPIRFKYELIDRITV